MPMGNVPTLLRGLKRCCALVLSALLISCAPGQAPTISDSPPISTVEAPARPPAFKHIFVIVMENKDYERIIDNTGQAPYLNELAQQYGLATNYYAITHPSLPNYLALTGGSTFGIDSDCTDCTVPQPNLVDQLEVAGDPTGEKLSGGAARGEECGDQDVWIENRSHSATAATCGVFRFDRDLDRLRFGQIIALPKAVEQVQPEVPSKGVFDDLAVALAGAGSADLHGAQDLLVHGQCRSHLCHRRIIAS
jgi:hypothetical protein